MKHDYPVRRRPVLVAPLAGAEIDGVKYPVDSYGGKGVKDGGEAGWNYVSFRDDNIRVDHKWTDGEMRFSVSSPYDPRKKLVKPRKGWTEKAIKKELREGSLGGVWWGAKLMSEFDSVKELKEHMFYHGTENYLKNLKPSIVQTEKWAEKHGGGGYGDRYWGISVSKSKKVASNFGGQRTAGVGIYPVVLAKNAKVIERPEWTDALDVEGHVVELWNEGVDAVRIGDWAAGEMELLVLNPRAVAVAGNSDYYRMFMLGTESNPINIKDDAQLEKMLEVAKDYATYNEHDRFGKPYPPDLWKINDDGSYGEMKTAAERAALLKSYEDDLAVWRESEAGRAAEEYEYRVRDEIRFSVHVSPKLREDVEAALNTDRKTKAVQAGHTEVFIAEDTPRVLQDVGVQSGRIYTQAFILRKIRKDHGINADGIVKLADEMARPVAVFRDVMNKGETAYIILTGQSAKDLNGRDAPVMVYLREDKSGNYVASAYSKTKNGEKQFVNLVNAGGILALDKDKVTGLNLTGEVKSSFESVKTGDKVVDLSRSTLGIIAEPAADRSGVRYSRRGGGIDGALEDAESALRALDAGEVRTEDRLEEHLRDMSKAAWLHRAGDTDVPDRGASDYGGKTLLKA